MRILDDAAERFERVPLRFENAAHAPIERQRAEIRAPRHAYAFEAAFERSQELTRVRRHAAGITRICTRHRCQQVRDVRHRTGDGSFDREAEERQHSRAPSAPVRPSAESRRRC